EMTYSFRMRTALIGLAFLVAFAVSASAQLKIVDYNTAGIQNSSAMQSVVQAISQGNENLGPGKTQVIKPIDVMILEELSSGDIATMTSFLNGLAVGTYVASNVGSTTGSGGVGIVYRTDSIGLMEQLQVVDTSSNGAARGVMRFKLEPTGYDSASDFYI